LCPNTLLSTLLPNALMYLASACAPCIFIELLSAKLPTTMHEFYAQQKLLQDYFSAHIFRWRPPPPSGTVFTPQRT
jgi:hypothetical protein